MINYNNYLMFSVRSLSLAFYLCCRECRRARRTIPQRLDERRGTALQKECHPDLRRRRKRIESFRRASFRRARRTIHQRLGGPHSKRCAIRTYVAISRISESKGLPRVIVGHAVEIMMLVVHVPATRIGGGR